MRKRVLSGALITVLSLGLTGCGGSTAQIATLNSIESMGSESSVTNNYNLSYSDEQDMIYAQVADRTLLDLSTLDACTDNELQQAVAYMDEVNDVITGSTKAGEDTNLGLEGSDDGVTISHYLVDYLLTEFEKTPYTWQRTQTIVRGIDSESRSIIVDVVYKTIGHEKDVIPDSYIIHGEPDYAKKSEVRFNRYINLLETENNNPDDPSLEKDWKIWRDTYGDEKEIIKSQTENFPCDRIFQTGIQQTYNGLIDNETEKSGGTMTVRYILVPNYKLGINLGLTCEHLYVTNYKLDNDITEGKEVFTEEGYATISDEVQQLLYSYFNCIDESDFRGLYKLTKNFQGLDKHYEDVAQTTYSKHENFTLSLFSIQGTHITCGVTISSKVRARGSLMTYPVYTDRYYVELDLTDDQLQVSNLTLLSRQLEGEPAIATDAADTTGFIAGITIDNDDKLAIEDLICKFGAVQLNADTSSDDFGDIVDLSMSQSNLTSLKQNMMSLQGVKKVVWLQNYQQGSSNYASVKCRELFQDETNAIIEANTTYDFINKGGRWYIYVYDVNSSVRLDTTNLSATGSLCLCSPGKVEAYTSQVRGTTTSDTTVASDISVTYDHPEEIPKRKEAIKEQGKNKHSGSEVADLASDLGYDYDELMSYIDAIVTDDEEARSLVKTTLINAILMKSNLNDNLYDSSSELDADKNEVQSGLDTLNSIFVEDTNYMTISDVIRELIRNSAWS